jgi:hypothetical protein
VTVRPERETLEAAIRDYLDWQKAIHGGGSTVEMYRALVDEERPCPTVDEARDALAALAAAPDAQLDEALAEATALMTNEHVSWQGTAARLFALIEALAAAPDAICHTSTGAEAESQTRHNAAPDARLAEALREILAVRLDTTPGLDPEHVAHKARVEMRDIAAAALAAAREETT